MKIEKIIERIKSYNKCHHDTHLDMAIELLEKQIPKEPCEYCNERNMPLWWNNAGHPSESLIEPKFCPMCGRELR